MPFITMDATHALGRDEALKRLKDKFETARSRYGSNVRNLEEQWTDHTLNFSFSAMGMGVSGTVKVEDQSVKLNAEIPFAATFFKGAIESRIREELDRLLT
ncbi:MAG: polyhydroxyalkanoic acid system family protein [Pirellulales bacterium]|nr:polyhydroxyalkanoic acid system family protein [Pirellulales bacterium]